MAVHLTRAVEHLRAAHQVAWHAEVIQGSSGQRLVNEARLQMKDALVEFTKWEKVEQWRKEEAAKKPGWM